MRLRNEVARSFRRQRWGATGQWLVIWLNPNVIIEMASANRTTPTATIQTSCSDGYGLTALFCGVGAGGSRRMRDGRTAARSSTIFFPGFKSLLTRAALRPCGYDTVSDMDPTRVEDYGSGRGL